MLQAIRSKTASIVVKALAGLLIISFAAWGIEDFIGARATETSVAKVGDREIDPFEYEYEFEAEIQQLRRAFGGQLTDEQLASLGLGNAVLQRMINDTAIITESQSLGLSVSDANVTRQIRSDPAFAGFDGNFSRDRFNEVMFSAGFSEAGYVERVRADMANRQVLDAVGEAATMPSALASLLREHRYERRAAETLTILSADQADPGEPTDAQLEEVHASQAERFTAPEYRKITFVHLDPEQLMDGVDVTEEELVEAYDANADRYIRPETRTVQQMVFVDEGTAAEAARQLSEGKDFMEVATEVAKMEAAAVELGTMGPEGLLPSLAEAVFAVEEGAVTNTIKSPLGYHILRAVEVQEGEVRALDEVKDEVREIVARDRAIDALFDLSARFEDALGAGGTLEEAGRTVGVDAVQIDAVDRQGLAPSSARAAGLPNIASLLPIAFSSELGLESPLTEAGDKGFFMVRVDEVIPPALRPLDMIRSDVADAWKQLQREAAARAKAEEIAQLANAGTALEALAATVPGDVQTLEPQSRSDRDAGNASVRAEMFDLSPGEAGVAKISEGYVVVKVTTSTSPDATGEVPSTTEIAAALSDQMGQDVAQQMITAVRESLGVKVYQRVVDEVMRPGQYDPNRATRQLGY
jgi:peptidyl-prolyl cis-trans isomerase D